MWPVRKGSFTVVKWVLQLNKEQQARPSTTCHQLSSVTSITGVNYDVIAFISMNEIFKKILINATEDSNK